MKMNVDFSVKEVGAETFVVTLHVATRGGLRTLLEFLQQQAIRTEPPPDEEGVGS